MKNNININKICQDMSTLCSRIDPHTLQHVDSKNIIVKVHNYSTYLYRGL